MAEEQAGNQRSRTFNMTVLYPPSMTGEYEVRLASWTPPIDMFHEDSCTLYEIRAPGQDQFGCAAAANSLAVAPHLTQITAARGEGLSSEVEMKSPMAVLLFQEAIRRALVLRTKSTALFKRGQCSFVQKAKVSAAGGADLGNEWLFLYSLLYCVDILYFIHCYYHFHIFYHFHHASCSCIMYEVCSIPYIIFVSIVCICVCVWWQPSL
jgi:hypothetical protein